MLIAHAVPAQSILCVKLIVGALAEVHNESELTQPRRLRRRR